MSERPKTGERHPEPDGGTPGPGIEVPPDGTEAEVAADAAPPEVEGRGKHTFQALQAMYDGELGLIPAGGYFRAYKGSGKAKSHLVRLVEDEEVPDHVKAALGL